MSDVEEIFTSALSRLSPTDAHEILALKSEVVRAQVPEKLLQEDSGNPGDIVSIIAAMSLGQRIRLALLGNQTVRKLLIRDNNQKIALLVLENPRLSEIEIEEFARNAQLSGEILRTIGANPTWTKNYGIRLSLVSNPRTPISVSLRLLSVLRDNDISRLAKSKNIPNAVASQCLRLKSKRDGQNS